ncbi:Bifunctional protein : cob(II)yrinic acid a,c-diamide reductase and nicotinate-nucleotide--dimethylbenzimidazole phosphoribosyltransferase [Flavobacterium indicum GPTSA100-9 = DSM 17447]|uniref:Nicotinate-nucleotide--dimethylbenzimidazole phosphoribosyltransferase n=1 Tax=Flavobacterium indicum (strain DSM 17447 / CIP 109464 / GPTSA100-9) TaxID=1094466 RepID=H8XUA9_FLAIG|nr:nicotinate-nucleotide--dimethylbenzimidazole phosphoribosyltransferase [Flavobacterium indicum]CCG52892.1 Bifunctional protein : cob(II)yrinic acid a,c-diamide reductase and nicotinate-nucleotide--dimethylbenzimidazole phosphoribosyltransferase [Flavobacterium indicum GPTSA100-9 = DSM 17447]
MKSLYEIIDSRRDTRHFTNDEVPVEVLEKALQAGHKAPSVGLTDATRYYIIESSDIKKQVKELFTSYHKKSADQTDSESQKKSYLALKLEAIEEAPIGLVIAYDRSVLDQFTIGTVGSNEAVKFSSVCAAQNIWLSLTEQGYSMGWVSIINYHHFKKLLNLPDYIEPLGYFCIGKPATDYGKQPMLQQLNWKQKLEKPFVTTIKNFTPVNHLELENFAVLHSNSSDLKEKLIDKINQKTKPLGSLGILEKLALQMGLVFQSEAPNIINPTIVVFAADHGIANHDVSAYPQEVTRQMVETFLKGGAAISVFCKQNNLDLKIVDAGVNYDFPTNTSIINKKVAKGTQSFLMTSAMSQDELNLCFQYGAEVVNEIYKSGSNCIGFGEMGIGNTSTASVLMSVLTNIPIQDCIGKGTGVMDEKLKNKIEILSQAIATYKGENNLDNLIRYFGGFEILQMSGGMLQAYQNKMLILVDGFISTVAFLIAYQKNSAIKQNAIFSHCSEEKAHIDLLNYLQVEPILSLNMRLGEGSGCAVAFPIIQSALTFINEMATFESAGVSNK